VPEAGDSAWKTTAKATNKNKVVGQATNNNKRADTCGSRQCLIIMNNKIIELVLRSTIHHACPPAFAEAATRRQAMTVK
jgi:hypothetical protein